MTPNDCLYIWYKLIENKAGVPVSAEIRCTYQRSVPNLNNIRVKVINPEVDCEDCAFFFPYARPHKEYVVHMNELRGVKE